jgi:hypothetical protein
MKEYTSWTMDIVHSCESEERIKTLFNGGWVRLEALRGTYQYLVNRKEIKALEELEKSEKERLWAIVKKWVQGDKERLILCCKALYLIETLQETRFSI